MKILNSGFFMLPFQLIGVFLGMWLFTTKPHFVWMILIIYNMFFTYWWVRDIANKFNKI